jgi:hypothetical protein
MEDHQHFSYAPFLLSSGERSVGPDKRGTRPHGFQVSEFVTYRESAGQLLTFRSTVRN